MTNMAKQEPTSFTVISSISTTPCTQTQQTLPHFYKPVLSQPRVPMNGGGQLKLVHNSSYKVTSQTQTIDSSSRENAIFSNNSMEHEVFSSNETEEDDSKEDNTVASGCCLVLACAMLGELVYSMLFQDSAVDAIDAIDVAVEGGQ